MSVHMENQYVPFTEASELYGDLNIRESHLHSSRGIHYLPGQPSIDLASQRVLPFLERDLLTPQLNQMSPWLWLVATPSSTHITALHAQLARGRNIVITEDPEMHLVWINDKIFVKPLPAYLLSHAFWSHYLSYSKQPDCDHTVDRRLQLRKAALGYIRTYVHLIKHESDLRIAKSEHLVPEDLNLETWVAFSRHFEDINDHQVSGRYQYGDLRLPRLNFWAKLILHRPYFRKAAWQYADHFARYTVPLLFVFTTWSVILSCMQVGLQSSPQSNELASISAWFSISSLIGIAAVVAFLLGAFSILVGREVIYAFSKQICRNRRLRTRESKALDQGSKFGDPDQMC